MRTPTIPETLRRNAVRGFGDRGARWLESLPETLERCAERFGLELGPPVAEINANYVGYARTATGFDVILKVAVPHRDFSTEIEALAIYEGRGINRLVDRDDELSAIVLERITPGKMLSEIEDPIERIRIDAGIIERLHSVAPPANHNLPHFMDWMTGAFEDARSCKNPERSRPYIDQIPKIESIMSRFMRDDEPQLLLHGDLHHLNILLDSERGWTAIDPKGVIGARVLETGRFIGNIVDDEVTRGKKRGQVTDAVEAFAELLGESIERTYAGAFCDKVMGSSWELSNPPDPGEPQVRDTLEAWLEVGSDIDLSKL